MDTHEWEDIFGERHKFAIYPISEFRPFSPSPLSDLSKRAGIYIFARPTALPSLEDLEEAPGGVFGNPSFQSIYIGETGDLTDRVGRHHEKWDCALKEGMSEVHIRTAKEDGRLAINSTRRQIEKRLKQKHPDLF